MVRVRSVPTGTGQPFDLRALPHCAAWIEGCQHVRVDLAAEPLRLDVVEGDLAAGPALVEPVVDTARSLEEQFGSIRRLAAVLRGEELPVVEDTRLRRLVSALRVADALAAGASQREIGLGALDGADWPGDGEHLKSRVRRMIPLAAELVCAGWRGVLRRRI